MNENDLYKKHTELLSQIEQTILSDYSEQLKNLRGTARIFSDEEGALYFVVQYSITYPVLEQSYDSHLKLSDEVFLYFDNYTSETLMLLLGGHYEKVMAYIKEHGLTVYYHDVEYGIKRAKEKVAYSEMVLKELK